VDFFERVLSDESFRNEQFPVTRGSVYMGHASGAPFCTRVAEAIRAFVEDGSVQLPQHPGAVDRVEETRAMAATLIGARPEEIALVGPTGLGISTIANGIAWQPDDEVVGYYDDYPANVYAWTALKERGVRFVSVRPERPGAITWDHIGPLLSERTRLVALSSCHFLSGYSIDVDGIGRALRERGILFAVDAIQSAGATPVSVENVDFLAADSHKWLMGTATAGVLYVRREAQEALVPRAVGARNVESPDYVAQHAPQFLPDARRYEPGILNFLGLHALHASLTLIHEIGIDRIGERVRAIRKDLADALYPLGFRDVLDGTNGARAGILTVSHPERPAAEVYEQLLREHIVTSLRRDRAGGAYVRFSPHFYATRSDMDRVVQTLS